MTATDAGFEALPGGIVVGRLPIVTKLSAAVTEFTVIVPPPAFCKFRDSEIDCGLAVWEEKESRLGVTASCGGAAATFSVTAMV